MKFYTQGSAWHASGPCYQPSLGRETPDCRAHSWWCEVEAEDKDEAWQKVTVELHADGFKGHISEFASFKNPDGGWLRG